MTPPERWLAAVGATIAVWLLAHVAGLLWQRQRLARRTDLTVRERWAAMYSFRRTLSAVTLVGTYLTIVALQPRQAIALAGATAAFANLLLLVVPGTVFRLIGAPLTHPLRERALPAERRSRPVRLALRELNTAVGSLLSSTLFYWWLANAMRGWLPLPASAEQWLPRLTLLLAATGALTWCAQVALAAKPTQVGIVDSQRTGAITDELRRLTSALGLPTPSFEFATRLRSYLPEQIRPDSRRIQVPVRIALTLEPEQTAALMAAGLLSASARPDDGSGKSASCLFWILGLGVTGWLIAALLLRKLPAWLAAGVLLLLLAGALLFPLYQRRQARSAAEADHRVAGQLSDPGLFLLALETLEQRESERLLPEEAGNLAPLRLRIEALRRAFRAGELPAVSHAATEHA